MTTDKTQILKAGSYFIGDPCYVIEDKEWDNYLNEYLFEKEGEVGIFKGNNVWAAGTMYGDGLYTDNQGTGRFPVDAGIIGVTPIELCSISLKEMENCGKVVKFEKGFVPECISGVFYIDNIKIDTTGEDEEEEDWDEEEEDWDDEEFDEDYN